MALSSRSRSACLDSEWTQALRLRTLTIVLRAQLVVSSLAIAFWSRAAGAQLQYFPDVIALDSLLQSAGPTWQQARSPHFVLYAERGVPMPLSSAKFLDSLEDAWTHDSALLGAYGIDQLPVAVLVTHSPSRFPAVLVSSNRGVVRRDNLGGDVIILVHNDSVRAFTRLEVMHVIQRRLWGSPGPPWVDEGIATFADGRCQSTTVLAVARDLLHAEPGLRASDLAERYRTGAGPLLGRRIRAYALAASFVNFVYDRGGAEALHVLRRDGSPPSRLFPAMDSLTEPWRTYVEHAAAGKPGLSPSALDAGGCG
jgi:hypothetical protein